MPINGPSPLLPTSAPPTHGHAAGPLKYVHLSSPRTSTGRPQQGTTTALRRAEQHTLCSYCSHRKMKSLRCPTRLTHKGKRRPAKLTYDENDDGLGLLAVEVYTVFKRSAILIGSRIRKGYDQQDHAPLMSYPIWQIHDADDVRDVNARL